MVREGDAAPDFTAPMRTPDGDISEFTLSEARRAELREEALQSAIEAARNESEYVAGEVDQSVVGVKSVDTSGGGISPVSRDYPTAEAADSGATELQPDDVTVRATARITYVIG